MATSITENHARRFTIHFDDLPARRAAELETGVDPGHCAGWITVEIQQPGPGRAWQAEALRQLADAIAAEEG